MYSQRTGIHQGTQNNWFVLSYSICLWENISSGKRIYIYIFSNVKCEQIKCLKRVKCQLGIRLYYLCFVCINIYITHLRQFLIQTRTTINMTAITAYYYNNSRNWNTENYNKLTHYMNNNAQ